MQAIMETLFDIYYFATVFTLGFKMIAKAKDPQFKLYGYMAIVLGAGDAFHLVPRVLALNTTGLENWTATLGTGKLITSITMTIFYVILYYVLCKRYNYNNKSTTIWIYLLAIVRIALCLFPQNAWTSADAPLSWAIYRNIPFTILGIVMIVLAMKLSKQHNDASFKNLGLAIILSFGFYAPVVLFANTYPLVGMLMIPKTVAYIWIVYMGYNAMKKEDLAE